MSRASDHTQKYCNNDNMFYYQQTAQQISSTHTHIRDYSNMFQLFLTAIFTGSIDVQRINMDFIFIQTYQYICTLITEQNRGEQNPLFQLAINTGLTSQLFHNTYRTIHTNQFQHNNESRW